MNKPLNFLLSLITDDNDYQIEQAAAAQDTARQLGVNLEILYAQSDSVTQSQQLLTAIQGPGASRPDAILFEPAGGTGLPQVATAAVAAGIGWCILNRDAPYTTDLRRTAKVPVFSVGTDHREVGRIQARQLAALLPVGGLVLYIQGPSENFAAQQRTAGIQEAKAASIQFTLLRGQWTEASAFRSVSSWLRLTTSQKARLEAVVAQNDTMAIGARKAIEAHVSEAERDHWLRLPFLGVDGLPKTGQAWVRSGLLTATIVCPPNTVPAVEVMVHALQNGIQPPERKYMTPRSFPEVEDLLASRLKK
jgi:ABC-type sugar transport system substrate-binding protein